MRNIELIIKQVDASMAMEGMPLTKKDKDRIRCCIGDNQKVENTIHDLVNQYITQSELRYGQRLVTAMRLMNATVIHILMF